MVETLYQDTIKNGWSIISRYDKECMKHCVRGMIKNGPNIASRYD